MKCVVWDQAPSICAACLQVDSAPQPFWPLSTFSSAPSALAALTSLLPSLTASIPSLRSCSLAADVRPASPHLDSNASGSHSWASSVFGTAVKQSTSDGCVLQQVCVEPAADEVRSYAQHQAQATAEATTGQSSSCLRPQKHWQTAFRWGWGQHYDAALPEPAAHSNSLYTAAQQSVPVIHRWSWGRQQQPEPEPSGAAQPGASAGAPPSPSGDGVTGPSRQTVPFRIHRKS